MPCYPFAGGVICMGRAQRQRCSECSKDSVALCDFPTRHGKTCDRRMCGEHRHRVGPNVDHCSWHVSPEPEQMRLA